MPVKSQSQLRWLRQAERDGRVPPGTVERWLKHTTTPIEELPERVELPVKQAGEEEAAAGPPNYRPAVGSMQTCGNCQSFDAATNSCQQFAMPVQVTDVCDAWQPNQSQISQVKLDTSVLPPPPDLEKALPGGDIKLASTTPAQANPIQKLQPVGAPGTTTAPRPNQVPLQQVAGIQPQPLQPQPPQAPQPAPQPAPTPDPASPVPVTNIQAWLQQLNRLPVTGNGQSPPQPEPQPGVKQANWLVRLLRGLKPVASGTAQTLGGAAAGAGVGAVVNHYAGIESDLGQVMTPLLYGLGGSVIGNPITRRHFYFRTQQPEMLRALRELPPNSTVNKSFLDGFQGLVPASKLKSALGTTTVAGAIAGGSWAADRGRRGIDRAVKILETNQELMDDPSAYLRKNFIDPAIKTHVNPQLDKWRATAKDVAMETLPPLTIGMGGSLLGGLGGLMMGSRLSRLVYPVMYDNKKRELAAGRTPRTLGLLLGAYGGALGGGALASMFAPQIQAYLTKQYKAYAGNSSTPAAPTPPAASKPAEVKKAEESLLTRRRQDDSWQPRVRVMLPTTEGRYLLEKLRNKKYPQNLNKLRFPGGGVDLGETLTEAAVREMQEELKYKLNPRHLRYRGQDPRPGYEGEHYFELPRHTLRPGRYDDAVGGDSTVHLVDRKPGGRKYMGAPLEQLLLASQRLRTKKAEEPQTYEFRGNVTGVGLRKALHQLLEQQKLPGLAYNDGYTDAVYATVGGDKTRQDEVLAQLRSYLDEENKGKYQLHPISRQDKLRRITLRPEHQRRMFERQGFTETLARTDLPSDYFQNWIRDRYRLQPTARGNLSGRVPDRAREQLLGLAPIYPEQLERPEEFGPVYWRQKHQHTKKASGLFDFAIPDPNALVKARQAMEQKFEKEYPHSLGNKLRYAWGATQGAGAGLWQSARGDYTPPPPKPAVLPDFGAISFNDFRNVMHGQGNPETRQLLDRALQPVYHNTGYHRGADWARKTFDPVTQWVRKNPGLSAGIGGAGLLGLTGLAAWMRPAEDEDDA